MRRASRSLFFFAVLLLCGCNRIAIVNPTVEMQNGSMPLATAEPRFSWQYEAEVKHAHWIGRDYEDDNLNGHTAIAARYLRYEFPLDKKYIERASLYISGLGVYSAMVTASSGTSSFPPTPQPKSICQPKTAMPRDKSSSAAAAIILKQC